MNRTLLTEQTKSSVITFAERPGVEFRISEKENGRGASCIVYHAVGSDNTEHLLKEYYPKHLELPRDGSGQIVVPEDKKELFEQGLSRFRTGCERQKSIRLSNRGLKNFTCNVQGYYAANGTEYIDMTCFNGQTYDHVQEKSVYNLMLRMRTLAQVVGNYHKAGLLHLDIKPENIYVRPESETVEDVMLFDFDSVTPMNEIVVSKALSCTKIWAAPEQLLSEKRRSICPATDIFSIGEIIFVQLFGRHSTSAERRSFVTEYAYDYNAEIFKDMNPKVFPLLDDLLCHTICGMVGKRYQSAEELIAKLDKIIKIANPEAPYLKSSLHAVQDFFVGRENEIVEIHCKLSENRILFLNGIGGIGKSELAKHYAQEHKDDYDAIIFAPYVSDVNMLLQDDTAIPLYNFSQYPEEKPEEYCARKLHKLQELCDERTLFIVDNLDREDDSDLKKLLNLGCKLLITTRMDFSDYGYVQQLYLDALCSRNSIFEIFHKYYTKPLTAEEAACVEQIIDLVAGHTMTVELLAKQMMAGRVKPDKMLAKLQNGGISESGKEKVRSGKDGVLSAQSAYGHIQALFDLSELDENERYILANLSLIPYTGISTELFHDWCELNDYNGINCLVVEGWIRRNEEQDSISLHPLIADISRKALLTEARISVLITKINSLLLDTDNFSSSDTSLYSPLFICAVNALCQQKLASREIMCFNWRVGSYFVHNTGSIEFAEQIMESALDWEARNIADLESFRLRISVYLSILKSHMALFQNKNDREQKLSKWYTKYKGLNAIPEMQGSSNLTTEIVNLSTLERHYSNMMDMDNAKDCHIKMVQLFQSLSVNDTTNMLLYEDGCEAICNIAEASEALGNFEQAKRLYQLVMQSPNAAKEEKELASMGLIGIYMNDEDWDNGICACEQYHHFLKAHYPEEHKEYIWYFQFLFCCLCNSLALSIEKDCKTVSPNEIQNALDVFWKYKALYTQYYGELTIVDFHFISGFAHLIVGYVLYYLEINADDYVGNDIWSEMNLQTASVLLYEAKKLFELVDEQGEVNEIAQYLTYIEEKMTNDQSCEDK